jgi:hypothetical protein
MMLHCVSNLIEAFTLCGWRSFVVDYRASSSIFLLGGHTEVYCMEVSGVAGAMEGRLLQPATRNRRLHNPPLLLDGHLDKFLVVG